MYTIIGRNYKTGKLIVIYKTISKREAEANVESIAHAFVKSREGEVPFRIYESKSKKFGKVPFGHFICKSSKFAKFTVMNKVKIPGLIYNTYRIEKVVSFQVLRDETEEPEPEPDLIQLRSADRDLLERSEDWKEIHSRIILHSAEKEKK